MADNRQRNDAQRNKTKPLTEGELEIVKMYLDAFKHMTTFCSGAVVVVATVVGVLFPKPHYGYFLAMSIAFLLVGAAAAMFGLSSIIPYLAPSNQDVSASRAIEQLERLTKPLSLTILGRPSELLWTSVLSAYFGIAVFAFFTMFNLAF